MVVSERLRGYITELADLHDSCTADADCGVPQRNVSYLHHNELHVPV